jgi:hypothetical protein
MAVNAGVEVYPPTLFAGKLELGSGDKLGQHHNNRDSRLRVTSMN